ncbi:MAG: hypothetical protein HDT23_05950 [Ruminococcus sp.]|nr:hypothetical protein [Ruminococcus sp.]
MSAFISKIIEFLQNLKERISEFFGLNTSCQNNLLPYNDYENITDETEENTGTGDFYDQNIEDIPLNTDNDNIITENKETDFRELYEYFIIPEKKSAFPTDSQNFIQYYIEKFEDVSEMQNYINEHNVVFLSNIGRHLDSYLKQLGKITENLSENPEYEELIKNLFDCISKHFISKTARQISGHISEEESQQYCIEFLEIFNRYLSDIGIYTYNECIQGSPMSDEDYNYYEVEALYVSNENLDGIVKKLEYLPYLINYTDYRGKICSLCLSGQLTAYTAGY